MTPDLISYAIYAAVFLVGYWLRHKGVNLPFFNIPTTPAGGAPTAPTEHPLLNTLDLLAKVQQALKDILQQSQPPATQATK
jgi:hypothetical protein